MPDGTLELFDPKMGEGRITHGSREYVAVAAEIEPKARKSGVRVHFDIDRRPKGEADLAVNVRLRSGTRTSPKQRRFGDSVGATHTADPHGDPSEPQEHNMKRGLKRDFGSTRPTAR